MPSVEIQGLTPEGWQRGAGFSHGMTASGGTRLWIAGQIAHENGLGLVSSDFARQWDQCLGNVVAVVRAAGGAVDNITSLTVYVTSMKEYQANLRDLAEPWKRHFGRHFPAIALLAVSELLVPAAKIEIQGEAVL